MRGWGGLAMGVGAAWMAIATGLHGVRAILFVVAVLLVAFGVIDLATYESKEQPAEKKEPGR